MNIFLGGIISLLIIGVIMLIHNIVIATNDPEVIEASNLKMSISRYRIYKQMSEEIQEIFREEGINSKSEAKVDRIIMRAPNLNEWRRFSKNEERKASESMRNELNNLYEQKHEPLHING